MTEMDTSSKPITRDDLEVINRPDSQALFDPVTGELHALNATAMAIWQACDGMTTAGEIADAIAQLSGLQPDLALKSVSTTLSQLVGLNLVVIQEE